MHGGDDTSGQQLGAAVRDAQAGPEPHDRRFLFLQGPLSPLFSKIGGHLQEAGAKVQRINLCFGDWMQWHGAGTVNYRGRVEAWPQYIQHFISSQNITDLIVHGDQRVYHKAAIDAAFHAGARVFVTELGMLRNGWMTLERNGLSTLSCFPEDPDEIRAIAQCVIETGGRSDLKQSFPKSTWLEIGPDVFYNLANVFLRPLYPFFQRHTVPHPVPEYVRGARKLLWQSKRDKKANDVIRKVIRGRDPVFLLPLQLEGDFQLRAHSPYDDFSQVLDVILTSFGSHAPRNAKLLIKTHPLDVGFTDWREVLQNLGRRRGAAGRLHLVDGARLSDIFPHVRGMVTLNSTAGLEALQAGVPVKTLVPAHYDIKGLTHSGSLDSFWDTPEEPDQELLEAYCQAIAATIQVPGSIHNHRGTDVAAENMARRMLELSVNEPNGYVFPPPRLARARAMGVPL